MTLKLIRIILPIFNIIMYTCNSYIAVACYNYVPTYMIIRGIPHAALVIISILSLIHKKKINNRVYPLSFMAVSVIYNFVTSNILHINPVTGLTAYLETLGGVAFGLIITLQLMMAVFFILFCKRKFFLTYSALISAFYVACILYNIFLAAANMEVTIAFSLSELLLQITYLLCFNNCFSRNNSFDLDNKFLDRFYSFFFDN